MAFLDLHTGTTNFKEIRKIINKTSRKVRKCLFKMGRKNTRKHTTTTQPLSLSSLSCYVADLEFLASHSKNLIRSKKEIQG